MMDGESNNPYIAPSEGVEASPRKICGTKGSNRCPNCNAPISRWKIGNSIQTSRCEGCKSKLWMEFGWKFFIANAIGIIAFYFLCVTLPPYLGIDAGLQNALSGFQKITQTIWLLAIIFLRVFFGYPVAYRNLD